MNTKVYCVGDKVVVGLDTGGDDGVGSVATISGVTDRRVNGQIVYNITYDETGSKTVISSTWLEEVRRG